MKIHQMDPDVMPEEIVSRYERNDVIRQFEETIANYAGAKYGIAVESCSAALFLSCLYLKVGKVTIPKKTYHSVPCSIIHAGGKVKFSNDKWSGIYQLKPYPIWDSAIRFKRDMYIPSTFYCLSFHYAKHIPIGRGGMILVDDIEAAEWLRKARHDGRSEVPRHEDKITMLGWNMYLDPELAARGLALFYFITQDNKDLPDLKINYEDLSQFKVYA